MILKGIGWGLIDWYFELKTCDELKINEREK